VLIAAFRCAAPARCGGFADERRVVAATEAGESTDERCASLVASFAAGNSLQTLVGATLHEAGARTDVPRMWWITSSR